MRHDYVSALSRSADSVLHESVYRPAGKVHTIFDCASHRPPGKLVFGPAGIPGTRFHFKTEVLRFGRVGNTCILGWAQPPQLTMPLLKRFVITFPAKAGQTQTSHRDVYKAPVLTGES